MKKKKKKKKKKANFIFSDFVPLLICHFWMFVLQFVLGSHTIWPDYIISGNSSNHNISKITRLQKRACIRAVSPELSLFAHTIKGVRGSFRQRATSMALLNGWTCAFWRISNCTTVRSLFSWVDYSVHFKTAKLQLQMLSFEHSVFLNKAKMMFKVVNHLIPEYVCELFERRAVNSLNMSLGSNSNHSRKNLSYSGPVICSSIPYEITNIATLGSFSEKLVKWMITHAYALYKMYIVSVKISLLHHTFVILHVNIDFFFLLLLYCCCCWYFKFPSFVFIFMCCMYSMYFVIVMRVSWKIWAIPNE